jgi:hypothetical protein
MTSDGIIEAIMTIWNDVVFWALQSMFSEWIQRVTLVIEHGRSITMNDCHSFLKEFSFVEKARTFGSPIYRWIAMRRRNGIGSMAFLHYPSRSY